MGDIKSNETEENKSIFALNKTFGSLNIPGNYSLSDMDKKIDNDNMNISNNDPYTPAINSTLFEDNYTVSQFNYEPLANHVKRKLSTLSGVFSPVALSMFSVLLFLRLGFVVGHTGLIGAFVQYSLAYFILLTTVLSIAAVSTNGAVEGGGAYFMISRTLGPEFGGSIGLIFFFANVFSSALYSVGCAEALIESFGPGGTYAPSPDNHPTSLLGFTSLPDTLWWSILYASAVNFLNLVVCLFGSAAFAHASLSVLCAIVLCGLSIPISMIIRTEPECIGIPRNNAFVYPKSTTTTTMATFAPISNVTLPTTFSTLTPFISNMSSNFTLSADAIGSDTSTIAVSLLVNNLTLTSVWQNISNLTSSTTLTPATIDPPFVCGNYTGLNWATLLGNLRPGYSIDYTTGVITSFMTVFAVIFSGATGIMAGANMSGDLKDPQQSIPKGTLLAVLFTFSTYIVFSCLVAASCTGFLLRNNYMVLAQINVWSPFITIGILLATLTAGLSNMIGASRILEAVARDQIFGSAFLFLTKSTRGGNPIASVLVTWFLTQIAIIMGGGSLNKIAGIVSVFFLLSYLAINISCFALDLASAPNFRPSFKYFSWQTALLGSLSCFVVMFAVTPTFSLVGLVICGFLVCLLHWRTPASSWGSLSQALIFHQVRKFLLKLDLRKDHVKYWRPQILQLVSDPKTSCELIDFANDLKKSGLFVIGHVYQDTPSTTLSLQSTMLDPIAEKLNQWLTLVDVLKVKAFVELTLADSVRSGARQLIRLSGLGAMKPNIVIIGFPGSLNRTTRKSFHKISNLNMRNFNGTGDGETASFANLFAKLCLVRPEIRDYFTDQVDVAIQGKGDEDNSLKATVKSSSPVIGIQDYVALINDCISMGKAVILTRNFHNFDKRYLLTGSSLDGTLRYLSRDRQPDLRYIVRKLKATFATNSRPGRRNVRCFIDVWPQNFFTYQLRSWNSIGQPCTRHDQSHRHDPLNHQTSDQPQLTKFTLDEHESARVDIVNPSPQRLGVKWNGPLTCECQRCCGNLNFHDSGILFILQLACVLNMKREWKKNSVLRVMICVEEGEEVEGGDIRKGGPSDHRTDNTREEFGTNIHRYVDKVNDLKTLLAKLRIPARIKIVPWSPSRLFPPNTPPNSSLHSFMSSTPIPQKENSLLQQEYFLPNKEYLTYLNKIILKHSKHYNSTELESAYDQFPTAVCFMYLPKPPPPSNNLISRNSISTDIDELSHSYMENLEILTRNLPSVCLVYGFKDVTTTSL